MKKNRENWLRIAQNLSEQSELSRMVLMAFRVTGNWETAEDAVQEAYLQILRNPPQYFGDTSFTSYFLTMVRNCALKTSRSARRRKVREETYHSLLTRNSTAVEHKVEIDEKSKILRSAIADLPRNEREVICLCCELGISREQAAKILGISKSTAVDRARRGLDLLRKRVIEKGHQALISMITVKYLSSLPLPEVSEKLQKTLNYFAENQPEHYEPALSPEKPTFPFWVGLFAIAALGVGLSYFFQGDGRKFAAEKVEGAEADPTKEQPLNKAAAATGGSFISFEDDFEDGLKDHWRVVVGDDERPGTGLTILDSLESKYVEVVERIDKAKGIKTKAAIIDGTTLPNRYVGMHLVKDFPAVPLVVEWEVTGLAYNKTGRRILEAGTVWVRGGVEESRESNSTAGVTMNKKYKFRVECAPCIGENGKQLLEFWKYRNGVLINHSYWSMGVIEIDILTLNAKVLIDNIKIYSPERAKPIEH